MATFSEWLALEEIRVDVYEESLIRLQLQEALRRTFEFYNLAASGRWELILETSLDDEDDDGIVPDYDPFADGSEEAKPVWTAPEEEDRPQVSRRAAPAPKKKSRQSESALFVAKNLQKYAQIVRWSAMLDRRDAVAEVTRIYTDEILPLLRRNEWIHAENTQDEDDDWGDSYFVDPKPGTKPSPAQPTIQQSSPIGHGKIAIIEKIKPLLEKLGYIGEGDLNHGTEDDKFEMVARAALAASKEKGNDPPKGAPEVQTLIDNPNSRAKYSELMMDEIRDILTRTAKNIYRQIRRSQGFEGGERKYGSEMDEGEILSSGVNLNMRKLQRRKVKKDGIAEDWDEDLKILTMDIDDEEDAARLINTIKSPISTPERALREKRREDRRASGLSGSGGGIFTCPACGHTRSVASRHVGTKMKCPKCQAEGLVQQAASSVSHDAGATAEDGTVTSMDVADKRTLDSLSAASSAETAKEMMDAFRQAMKELGQRDPSKATLVCLWLGLHGGNPPDCATTGRLPSDNAIKAVTSHLSSVNLSDRKAAKDAFERIGVDNLLPGARHGQIMEARWNLIKLIKQHNIPAVGVFRGMPPGEIPAGWTPKYTNRQSFTPEQDRWYKWMNSILDTLSKGCLPFIATRMQEIMAERQPDIKPKGWESPCSWSLHRFLRNTFAASIKAGTIALKGDNPIDITIYGTSKGKKTLRQYSLTTDGRNIKVVLMLDGRERDSRSYTHPQPNLPCAKCGGSPKGCSECEGCGRVIDRVETLKLERMISEFLIAQIGTRAARRKRPSPLV